MECLTRLNIPWRFRNDHTAKAKKSTHDTLAKEGQTPGVVALNKAAKVINPDTGSIAANIAGEFNTSKFPSVMRRA